nr:hypothetical protein [uncultured Sphingomonas sp.]
MDADDIGLRFHVTGVALAHRDNLELTGERLCRILEAGACRLWPTTAVIRHRARFSNERLARTVDQGDTAAPTLTVFDASLHVPIARKILGGGQALLFGRLPVVAAAEVGRALPEAAAVTLVNVQRAIHQNMALNGHV